MNAQLPLLAATCNAALPMPSRASFKRAATASSWLWEGEVGLVLEIVSWSRSMLLRRQASIMSSRGEAPWLIVRRGGDV